MEALHLDARGLTYQANHRRPRPADGEALIRMEVAGICATDLELVRGYAGFSGVPGHEFVGVVEASSESPWLGRRVVGSINIGCGRCAACLAAGPEHCRGRRVLGIRGHDGAFAEYLTLPISNLLTVPRDLPSEAAVFTEPLAAALRVREQIRPAPSTRAAVVGPGRLGLLIAQALALDGTDLTVLGRHSSRLELPERLGLRTGLTADSEDEAFDLVVEATGNAAGFAESLRLVRAGGTLVLKSTFAGQVTLDLSQLVVREIRLVGSRCGPFAPALRLLAAGRIGTRPLVEARYPLERGLEAFEHAARPGVRKVLLTPSGPHP